MKALLILISFLALGIQAQGAFDLSQLDCEMKVKKIERIPGGRDKHTLLANKPMKYVGGAGNPPTLPREYMLYASYKQNGVEYRVDISEDGAVSKNYPNYVSLTVYDKNTKTFLGTSGVSRNLDNLDSPPMFNEGNLVIGWSNRDSSVSVWCK